MKIHYFPSPAAANTLTTEELRGQFMIGGILMPERSRGDGHFAIERYKPWVLALWTAAAAPAIAEDPPDVLAQAKDVSGGSPAGQQREVTR